MPSNRKTLIDGDFEVGSAHLYVDVENNRVGLNQANPASSLDVNGDIAVRGTTFIKANTGTNNLAIGTDAGTTSQGDNAVALGNQAGKTGQGSSATAVGHLAGLTGQGTHATAVGRQAGEGSQGSSATAVGHLAGQTGQGLQATAVGRLAGQTSQGNYTTAVGRQAGMTEQEGQATAVGNQAGESSQSYQAVAVGSSAGQSSQGSYAVAVGSSAGQTSQGNNTVAVGREAGQTGQGSDSVVVGYLAGQTSQGNFATAVGSSAGKTSQGASSTAVGRRAGETEQGSSATAVGHLAGATGQGSSAVAVGIQAGQTSQGHSATAVGLLAGRYNQSSRAVAVGRLAGQTSQGVASTAVGNQAGLTGQGNFGVAVGHVAGETGQGNNAIAVGREAGRTSQADNSIILNASGSEFNTTTASSFHVKPVRGGNFAASALAYTSTGEIVEETGTHFDTSGNVGIGTADPSSILNTYGGDLWDGADHTSQVCATLQVGRGAGVGDSAADQDTGAILEFRHSSDYRYVTIESVSEQTYSQDIGLRFKTVDGTGGPVERMRIDASGNVGIGTTSPETALQLHRLYGSDSLLSAGEIKFSTNNTEAATWDVGSIRGAVKLNAGGSSNYPGGIVFATKSPGSASGALTDKMVIDANGSVGIGTTNPTSKLETMINDDTGTSNTIALTIFADSSDHTNVADGFGSRIRFDTNRGTNAGGRNPSADIKGYIRSGAGTTGDFHALDLDVYGNDGALNPGISIVSKSHIVGTPADTLIHGNVGIGTTNPSDKLHIYGSPMIQHDTVYNFDNSQGWYKIGVWDPTGITGARLKISFLGMEGYSSQNIVRGGETILYASCNNNVPATKANIDGRLHAYGDPVITQVKFVHLDGSRHKFEIRAYIKTFVQMSMTVECTQTESFTKDVTASTDPGSDSSTVSHALFTHVVNNNGNVGIGTTNPSSRLTVNEIPVHSASYDHSLAPMTITNRTPTSNSTLNDPKHVLNLAREGTNSESYGARATFKLSRYENNGSNSRTRLDLNLAHGSYDEPHIMTFRSDGNVGIGKTNPGAALDVNGTVKSG